MIVIDICLSDIPEWSRKKANNGKVYAKFCIVDRKEPDKFENTKTVYMNQSKEQREAKQDKAYVGAGKVLTFEAKAPVQQDAPRNEVENDVPF